ncbi:MAG: DUF116 domain-containing protein [Nitrospirae bacterium]|nr:DUF116 domain-containing protein [Nitrospirota bacterium]
MTHRGTHAPPVAGKTFSLFGTADAAASYYRAVGELADAFLVRQPDTAALIAEVRRLGKRPRLARRLSSGGGPSLAHFLVHTASIRLAPYTQAVHQHLRELSLLKRLDGVLSFIEVQYHLAMLEIELMNRACAERFRSSHRKLAFLPHCLRDLEANCRAATRDIDYACRGCSGICNVNAVSSLLRQHSIEPYLWMQADLKGLLRTLKDREGGLGVLGIACVPELVRGMRMCMKLDIPVVGVPLNANRCARWMGEPRPTSVEMKEVLRIVQGAQ